MAPNYVVPAQLADKFDKIRKEAVVGLLERRMRLKDGVGERPYKGEPVPETEALVKFGQIRNDPVEWNLIIQKVGKRQEDGTVLMPKKMMTKVRAMEAQLRQGVL